VAEGLPLGRQRIPLNVNEDRGRTGICGANVSQAQTGEGLLITGE